MSTANGRILCYLMSTKTLLLLIISLSNIPNVRSVDVAWNSNCRVENRSSVETLICDTSDTLDAFPRVPKHVAETLSFIEISDQPRLTTLKETDLKHFISLTSFSLTRSGLSFIELVNRTKNVFESSGRNLRNVDLSDNLFRTFDWRWFIGMKSVTLTLKGNPLECNCSLFWLADWYRVNDPKRFQSPRGGSFGLTVAMLVGFPEHINDLGELHCFDEASERQIPLVNWIRTNTSCSLPSVDVQPKVIQGTPKDDASFTCNVLSNGAQFIEPHVFRPVDYKFVIDKSATSRKIQTNIVSKSALSQNIRVVIPQVSFENMGWYVCVGVTDAGPEFDLTALVVKSKPRVNFTGVQGAIGDREIRYSFDIYAYPTINVTWLKNGTPVRFEKSSPTAPVPYRRSDFNRAEQQFYLFRTVFQVDLWFSYEYYIGKYSVRACNELGCDEIFFAENVNRSYFVAAKLFGPPSVSIFTTTMRYVREVVPGTANDEGTVDTSLIKAIIIVSSVFAACATIVSLSCLAFRRNCGGGRRRGAKDLRAIFGATETFPLKNYSTNIVYQPVLSSDVPLISRENVELIKEIGEGAFGKVYSATLLNRAGSVSSGSANVDRAPVAVKCLKNVTVERCEEFAREAELMAKLNHANVVSFYGVCLENADNSMLLMFEYMDLGDLKHFLAAHGPNAELIGAPSASEALSVAQLMNISVQVATGLEYLHKKHFVHRDLASRNCLCKSPLTVKLSDFGMSRDIYSSDYYRLTRKAPLPVRWLPPESLVYGKFTSHSDIWSLGVVLWEIFSYGVTPWFQYSNMDVLQQIVAGAMMPKPEGCSDALYELMLSCWRKTPNERPSANDLIRSLELLASTEHTSTVQ